MSTLHSDLSKLLSHLLEEDVALSPTEARHIAFRVNQQPDNMLDMVPYPTSPNGK
jgi:hypothetical protein